MAKIVFKKLTIKETENVRAGIRRSSDFNFGIYCIFPNTPGTDCSVMTPNLKTCRSRRKFTSAKFTIKM